VRGHRGGESATPRDLGQFATRSLEAKERTQQAVLSHPPGRHCSEVVSSLAPRVPTDSSRRIAHARRRSTTDRSCRSAGTMARSPPGLALAPGWSANHGGHRSDPRRQFTQFNSIIRANLKTLSFPGELRAGCFCKHL